MDRPDLAWKLLLRRRLPAVLARLAPGLHAAIDWGLGYDLPDKSLPPAAPDSRTGAREPDFVALVTLLDGRRACLHVEIQCTRQAGFADRMALYHWRLRDRFDMPVFSLAILGDRSPGWRPHASNDGCGTVFHFDTAKLLDFRGQLQGLQEALDPVSLVLAAHLIALSTRGKPDLRSRAKMTLLLPLYALRGTLKELTDIQEVLDWILPLPPNWQRSMTMDIEKFLEEHKKQNKNSLNYLIAEHFIQQGMATGIPKGEAMGIAKGEAMGIAKGEAMGIAKGEAMGIAKGEARGRRETLKLQLAVQFGRLSKNLQRTLDGANPGQLERLAIALLDAESIEEALRAAGL